MIEERYIQRCPQCWGRGSITIIKDKPNIYGIQGGTVKTCELCGGKCRVLVIATIEYQKLKDDEPNEPQYTITDTDKL